MKSKSITVPVLAAVLMSASAASWAQNVKITPLGSHAGELCGRDRAAITPA